MRYGILIVLFYTFKNKDFITYPVTKTLKKAFFDIRFLNTLY